MEDASKAGNGGAILCARGAFVGPPWALGDAGEGGFGRAEGAGLNKMGEIYPEGSSVSVADLQQQGDASPLLLFLGYRLRVVLGQLYPRFPEKPVALGALQVLLTSDTHKRLITRLYNASQCDPS
ncbi:hypothetical protein NDU88_005858 [Pleurodeles waltl]|uniref:Uncharacterized protein n=1 Tax=Pleurodeles waltl TaxID=8319 RepID=A0AAV7RKV3_PLEWA|nr:hypothetical protein NDU88_005858 [Pleurodeles waltl]